MPLLLVGVLISALAPATTLPSTRPTRGSSRSGLLPPSAGRAAAPPELSDATRRGARRPPAPRRVGSRERPARRGSPLGARLAVARRFALAYMPYQVGRLSRWARAAIRTTCTPGFARYLLAHPAQQPPLLTAHPSAAESYRVASVAPAAGANRVAVSYVSEQDSADSGAFVAVLTSQHGRWRVAAMEA